MFSFFFSLFFYILVKKPLKVKEVGLLLKELGINNWQSK